MDTLTTDRREEYRRRLSRKIRHYTAPVLRWCLGHAREEARELIQEELQKKERKHV